MEYGVWSRENVEWSGFTHYETADHISVTHFYQLPNFLVNIAANYINQMIRKYEAS